MATHHIAIFMYSLAGGGVPRRNITLANALASAGHRVDLVVVDAAGALRATVDPAVRVIALGGFATRLPWISWKRRRQFRLARRPLAAYLTAERPSVLLSADNYANLAALAARERAGVATPIVVSQRNHASTSMPRGGALVTAIVREYYKAEAIVCVSEGVADDLRALGLPADGIRTIYNPVVDERFLAAAASRVDHPWLAVAGRPLILGAGRIGPQKDFDTLLRAFARLKADGSPARLLILGEGKTRTDLTALKTLAESLGVGDDVDLPGVVPDAVPYIARADLFALSSRWEGLPGVLIEALACGVRIVSTDCPSGPDEILDGGAYGRLTPVGDVDGLAAAMAAALGEARDPDRLKARAQLFSTAEATRRYLALFDQLVRAASGRPA